MKLNEINFTKKDVEDFMEELNVNAVLENIDKMSANSESKFSSYNLNKYTNSISISFKGVQLSNYAEKETLSKVNTDDLTTDQNSEYRVINILNGEFA